jgi:hypothetical protein
MGGNSRTYKALETRRVENPSLMSIFEWKVMESALVEYEEVCSEAADAGKYKRLILSVLETTKNYQL